MPGHSKEEHIIIYKSTCDDFITSMIYIIKIDQKTFHYKKVTFFFTKMNKNYGLTTCGLLLAIVRGTVAAVFNLISGTTVTFSL